ncbi:MAG: orotidine-5'-phosphate decarboxylase, partial [Betaproteobacteria bacterium]|nr:orotidine-5'-phosphate decarboxylase [Betaproteobacteria bacterium]
PKRFPLPLQGKADALYRFCTNIADATAAYACAFKPQIAHFASLAAEECLQALMRYLRERHPTVPIILDAKRGDVGSTAEHYAREAFERYKADAVTVSPYMGSDSIAPYLAYRERGVIVLCRTSNPGAADLQDLQVTLPDDLHRLPDERIRLLKKARPDGRGLQLPLYQLVALLAVHRWDQHQQMALVLGATYPEELARVRELAPDIPLLVPGIGAQGGDVFKAVRAGRDREGRGMILNASRSILYASAEEDYAEAAARVARQTAELIREASDA